MKKPLKLIRIILAVLIYLAWMTGVHTFIDFHAEAYPELYTTDFNPLPYFLLLIMTFILLVFPITWMSLRAGYKLHRIHLLFLEITQPDQLRVRWTKKLGWQIRLLPPRTDGTSPIAAYHLGRYLCYAVTEVLFGVLTAILWRTPASRFLSMFFLSWGLYALLIPLLPIRSNGLDAYLALRKSRDLRRAWECSLHLIAEMENKTKLAKMPAEWFLPYPEELKDEPLVMYANFNRSAWLISQDRYAEGYEGLRYFFNLTPAPKTHRMIAMAILNGVVCEALGEDENGAKLPPMCMSQLEHPSLKLPLPPAWEAQRLQAEYARALFLHHDEAEAAAILPKWEAALDKAGRDREGIEKLQRKAGILPEDDVD